MENTPLGGVSPLKKSRWKGRRGKSGGTVGDTRYKRDKWVKPASGGTISRPAGTLPPAPKKPYEIKDGKVVPNVINNTYNYDSTNTINQGRGEEEETTTTTTPDTQDVYGKRKVTSLEKVKLPGYQEFWDNPDNWTEKDGKKTDKKYFNTYSTFEEFEKAAKEKPATPRYEKKEREETYLKSKGIKGSSVTTTKKKSTNGNNTAKINVNYGTPLTMLSSPGKYKLGGYRAMKKNRK